MSLLALRRARSSRRTCFLVTSMRRSLCRRRSEVTVVSFLVHALVTPTLSFSVIFVAGSALLSLPLPHRHIHSACLCDLLHIPFDRCNPLSFFVLLGTWGERDSEIESSVRLKHKGYLMTQTIQATQAQQQTARQVHATSKLLLGISVGLGSSSAKLEASRAVGRPAR